MGTDSAILLLFPIAKSQNRRPNITCVW